MREVSTNVVMVVMRCDAMREPGGFKLLGAQCGQATHARLQDGPYHPKLL